MGIDTYLTTFHATTYKFFIIPKVSLFPSAVHYTSCYRKICPYSSEVAGSGDSLSHWYISIKVQARQVQIELCWSGCTQSLRYVIFHLFWWDILIWQGSEHSYINTASRIVISKLIYSSPNLVSINSVNFLGVSVKWA